MNQDLLKLITFLKELLKKVTSTTFKSEVTNFPEQKDITVNVPEEVTIKNIDTLKESIMTSSSEVVKAVEAIDITLPENKDYSATLDSIKELLSVKKSERKDLTPEVVNGLKEVVKSINSQDIKIPETKIDFIELENKVETLIRLFDEVKRYDELKVRLPEKQIKALGKSISVTSGGGGTSGKVTNDSGERINPSTKEKQDDTITAIEDIGKKDITNNILESIDFANAKTHEGKHFKAGYMNEDLDDNDTLEVLFVTPDTTEWSHWSLSAEVVGYVKVEIFEDTVVTDNGTAITRLNRNRNSLIEASTLAFHSPTITTDGTKLVTKFLGSLTRNNEAVGDNFVANNHFLLKQNTKYLLRMTSKLDDTIAKLGGDWYEHINLI